MIEIREIQVPGVKAAMINVNCDRFNCELTETTFVCKGVVRVQICGTPENIDKLLDYVNEANESKKAAKY